MKLKTNLIILGILLLALVAVPSCSNKIISYTRCNNKLDNITKKIFNKNDINRVNLYNNWKLLIPCNYTHAERELRNLNYLNSNQLIYAITGMDKMVGKDQLWYHFEKKFGRNITKKYLPNTYLLRLENHMWLFQNNYRRDNMYILKKKHSKKERT